MTLPRNRRAGVRVTAGPHERSRDLVGREATHRRTNKEIYTPYRRRSCTPQNVIASQEEENWILQVLLASGTIRPRRCETQNRLRKTMTAIIANSDNVDVAGSGT